MKKVAVAGYATTKFSVDDVPIERLLLSATKQIFEKTNNITQKDIDAVLVSTNENKKYLSSIVSEMAGITPKISHSVESLCNSGANSMVSAYSYIQAGLADVALVVGAERAENPGQVLEWDVSRGDFAHPIFWGSLFTKSHKRNFGTTDEDLAYVSAKNHRQAKDNPAAYSQKQYSVDDVMNSKRLTDDLRLLDCSRSCAGGSAILLASEEAAKKITDSPIWITGIGQKTTSASFTKTELNSLASTANAATQAFAMSGIEPNQVDVAEIHDAFSVCELMVLEELGITQKGMASKYIKDLYDSNNRKINPRGGLIGAGHPLGATGVAQIAEIACQLQGNAQKRQVDAAKIGLVQNMSAAATSSTVVIMNS